MILLMKRWLLKFKSILIDLFSGIGLLWLFVEIASYSTNGRIDTYSKRVAFFIISFVLIFMVMFKNNVEISILAAMVFFYKR